MRTETMIISDQSVALKLSIHRQICIVLFYFYNKKYTARYGLLPWKKVKNRSRSISLDFNEYNLDGFHFDSMCHK